MVKTLLSVVNLRHDVGMADVPAVDITSGAFASRLANLLIATRTRNGLSVRQVARTSDARFTHRDLQQFEHGAGVLDETTIDELAQLYRCDLGVILPLRLPVSVAEGKVVAGGVEQAFDPHEPDALLAAYLALVRTLRHQRKSPVVDLRRDDVAALSTFLAVSPDTVVHRLATLMQASQAKRTAMVGVLATGAAVLGLVGPAMALGSSDTATTDTPTPTTIYVDPGTSTTTTTRTSTTTTSAPATTVTAGDLTTSTDVTTSSVANSTAPIAPPITAPPKGTAQPVPPVTTTTIVEVGPPPIPTDVSTTTIVEVGPPPIPPYLTTTTVDSGGPPIP